MNYYVYRHIRLDNNKVFYIGKGSKNRAYSKQNRNQYWHNIVNSVGYKVEILKENLSEQEAFDLEAGLIKSIKPEANFTLGGEGGDTFNNLPLKYQNHIRKKARERAFKPNSGVAVAAKLRKGKTKDSCPILADLSIKLSKSMKGKSNPMYGKSHWYNKTEKEKQSIKKRTSESLKLAYKNNPRRYDIVKCPHCGKKGGKPGMTRYHFDNCKIKK